MGMTARKTLLLSILALATVFLAQPQSHFSPLVPAQATGTESFSQSQPTIVYEQQISHNGAVDANPAGGLNGYCVTVANEDHLAAGGSSGFTVANGTVVDSATFNNGTSTTLDDVHCVIVQSNAAVSTMTVTWNYVHGAQNASIDLDLEVFVITLVGFDGAVGLPATVCTLGWEATLLTGLDSATPPVIPDPLDEVAISDWTTGQGSFLGDPFRNEGEWCVSIENGVAVGPFSVSLDFVLVQNRGTNADNLAITVTGVNIVSIATDPSFSEFRHVSPEGQLIHTQDTAAMVPGSIATACILPSAAADTLSASDVHWGSGVTGSITKIFHDTAGPDDLGGVPDGTLCFSWTASTPGTQFISLDFFKDSDSGMRHVTWDTDGTGNGAPPLTNTALIKSWLGVDHTEITDSTKLDLGDEDDPGTIVTDTTVFESLQFNIADGTWVLSGGAASYAEWVLGPGGELLDGAVINMQITSVCGYFADESDFGVSLGKTISGVSVGGRFDRLSQSDPFGDGPDDFHIGTTLDPSCTPNKNITIVIDVSHPGGAIIDTETLTIEFNSSSGAGNTTVPIVAWVGTTVSIPYAFSFTGSCGDAGNTVVFTRSLGPGSFLPSADFPASGPGSVSGTFADCSVEVLYESEDVGEVDIAVVVDGNVFSKVVYRIIYLAFEDLTTTSSPELFVSEIGDVSASVRGWFPGANPSGRPALTTPDGRRLPQDRWVLPDDWELLRGDSDFRANWPSSAPMPLTNVTFFMENEGVVNNFAAGVTHGGLGWMVLDGTESSFNAIPRTGIPSILGTPLQPRILTDLTDGNGLATIDSFGDFNVGYADCATNAWQGSPRCSRDDFLGATTYFAVAEYPENLGKWAPIQSNNATTDWLWAGYKEVTVEDGESPNIKYIVAHLRDRDGFCDAIGFNNTLGIQVEFLIDGGEGRIIEAADDNVFISPGRIRAVAHTFDTMDNFGNPINTDIVKPTLNDDECQAWVKIVNSTQTPSNVIVVFPPSPSPVPADLRITGMVCTDPESFTLTNNSDYTVWLQGFGVNSGKKNVLDQWEHYQLNGTLGAGESRTYVIEPDPLTFGFFNGNDTEVFQQDFGDWVNLMWNGFELSLWGCNGELLRPDIPAQLPFSGEGEILIDVLAQFNEEIKITFNEGWNFLTVPGENFMEALLDQHGDEVIAIYRWDPDAELWERRFPDLPIEFSNLTELEPGRAYWVHVKHSFTLSYQP